MWHLVKIFKNWKYAIYSTIVDKYIVKWTLQEIKTYLKNRAKAQYKEECKIIDKYFPKWWVDVENNYIR